MTAPLSALSPAERHRLVAAVFTGHVAAVVNWDAPTPVPGWVSRDVVEHLVDWSRDFLRAGDLELPADPPHRDEPGTSWTAHCADVQALLDGPLSSASFTHPYAGTHQLAEAIDRFYTADVFMHTWDLAVSAGRDPGLDPRFAQELLDGMSSIEDVLRSSGQFGAAVPVPVAADPVTRLAGFIGRDPLWAERTPGG